MSKLKHWRGFPGIFGLKGAWMLVFKKILVVCPLLFTTVSAISERHQSLDAHLSEQDIVERLCTFKIIGAECDITNHSDLHRVKEKRLV